MEKFLGEDIPKLGFGLMRLPMQGEEIDLEQTRRMADLFLEAGFTYFDTAYGYNNGESEACVKKVLAERYPRERYLLATKLPAWAGAKTKADAEQMFYTSLERTGAGYFDFYLLHNLGAGRTEVFERWDLWRFLEDRKREGLIRHFGFSFHDGADALDKLLTEHPEAEFVQLQINYADWESPSVQSRLCYETARRHGKPVIVMEPVKGGTLAALPPQAEAPLRAVRPDLSTASWGVRFAASLEGVITVLSGMSTMEQMEDNLRYMKQFQPLSGGERDALKAATAVLDAIPTIPCTGCDYCAKGCPQNIGISDTLKAVNLWKVYNNLPDARRNYHLPQKFGGKAPASACIRCGACEEVCPQEIHIMDELAGASALFETQ